MKGDNRARSFAEQRLFMFFDDDLQRLASMVRAVPDFPQSGVDFRHVLNVCQEPGGLALCTALMCTHFTGNWNQVQAVACCEAGGFIYASALSAKINTPLALIREAGKLPPPTISVPKSSSNISNFISQQPKGNSIEMDPYLIPRGSSVLVVDDVFATGQTLCAVIRLLKSGGVEVERVSVMVIAEFPIHRGRELLRQCGFGRVHTTASVGGL